MLEGELDASSGCLEGPLSVIIEVVEFQAAGCGVQGKFKCSLGDEQTQGVRAVTHLIDVSLLCGSASANLSIPDMSLPRFVRLLDSRLPGAGNVQMFTGR